MEILIWIGAALSCLGVAGLALCIIRGLKVRKMDANAPEAKLALQRLFVINFASLALSVIGLMVVIMGISLS